MLHRSIRHVFVHLSAVLIVLLIAFVVGKVGAGVRLEKEQVNGMLSSTVDSGLTVTNGTMITTTGTSGGPGTDSSLSTVTSSPDTTLSTTQTENVITTSAAQDLTYGVLPVSAAAYCEGGTRKTPVGFFTLPNAGGYFRVTYPTGAIMEISSGQLPLENGRYRWEGVPFMGYRSSGVSSGEFEISGSCDTASTVNPYQATGSDPYAAGVVAPVPVGTTEPVIRETTPTTSVVSATTSSPRASTTLMDQLVTNNNGLISTVASTTKIVPVLGQDIVTRVLRDSTLLINNAEVSGEVELRVVASKLKRVTFSAAMDGGVKKTLGDAEIDEFLSRPNEDVWTYFWKTNESPSGRYQLYATLESEDGKKGQSIPVYLRVSNLPPLAQERVSTVQTQVTVVERRTYTENVLTRVIDASGCTTPEECRVYCESSVDKNEECKDYVAMRATTTTTGTPPDTFALRRGARVFIDQDGDGISSYDETVLYGTDPRSPDTDGDGVLDGNELLARTNPRGDLVDRTASTTTVGETVQFEDPKQEGVLRPELLAVSEVLPFATSTIETGETKIDKIMIRGRAIPNSFITLYIFSDPIVVTVKTDADGAWSYILDKELPDGSHQVITAITDRGGKILAKSEPLPFVKQAAAITVGNDVFAPQVAQSPGFFSTPSLIALAALIIGVLGVALSLIGFAVHHKQDMEHSPLT